MGHVLFQCDEADESNRTKRTSKAFDLTSICPRRAFLLFDIRVRQSQMSKEIPHRTEPRSTGQTFDQIDIGVNTFHMTEQRLFGIKHRRTDDTSQ